MAKIDPAVIQEPDAEPTDAEIRVRAYHCWLDRGGVDGSPEVDWERAEQELRAENAAPDRKSKAVASPA